MDEEDIDNLINKMDIPSSGGDAKARTKQAAWMRLQQAQTNKQRWRLPSFITAPFGSPLAAGIAACLVLFVFASYSVTQSSRSGGGDAGSESNLVNSASLTQYPAGVRTSIVRMMVTNEEITPDKLRFNTSEELATLDTPAIGVFHPNGGGASPGKGPADIMADREEGKWLFNAELAVPNIRTEASEIAAFLPGIAESICARINEQLGILGIPRLQTDQSALYIKRMVDDGISDYIVPEHPPLLAAPELMGQPFGCFQSFDGASYVYYHVLVER